MEEARSKRPPASLLQRAVALLARREHSRIELARKLELRLEDGQDRGDIDAVLDELERRKLLSEERFASGKPGRACPAGALSRGQGLQQLSHPSGSCGRREL